MGLSVALAAGALLFREGFFSVFSVAKERLNTEVTETLRVLCVEAFKATEDTEKIVLVAARRVVLLFVKMFPSCANFAGSV
jgi:hypothetical protein